MSQVWQVLHPVVAYECAAVRLLDSIEGEIRVCKVTNRKAI